MSSCSADSITHRKTGTPISPVPIKSTRIARLELDAWNRRAPPLPPWGRCLRGHFVARRHLALADRRSAAGAKIIVDFLVGENQKEPLAHRHGGLALLAVETRRGEILKLLLAHAPRSP